MTQKTIQDLPDWVKDDIFSKDAIEKNKKIIADFSLSEKQKKVFLNTLQRIILKRVSLNDLEKELKPLGFDQEKTNKFITAFIKLRLLPLQEHFDHDVREYIKKFGGKLSEKQTTQFKPKKQVAMEQAIYKVIKQQNLSFDSDNMKQRFINISIAYLKGIRTAVETSITLKKQKSAKGMGFDNKTAENIVNLFKQQSQSAGKKPEYKPEKARQAGKKLDQELKRPEELISAETRMPAPPPKKEPAPAPAQTPAPSKTLEPKEEKTTKAEDKKKPAPPLPEKPKKPEFKPMSKPAPVPRPKPAPKPSTPVLPKKEPVAGPTPPSVEKKEPAPAQVKSVPKKVDPVPKKTAPAPAPPISSSSEKKVPASSPSQTPVPSVPERQKPPTQLPSKRKPVEEIKVKPRAQGPVDELRSLTLVDWRRWGSTQDAVQKIQDKINLLAEESLTQKAEAVKAWKESEINKMYLGLGEESINEGKSVEQVIKNRQQQGKPTLTNEEFNAVVELNQKLRF